MIITKREKEKTTVKYYNDKEQVQYTIELGTDCKFYNAVSRKTLKTIPVAVKNYACSADAGLLDQILTMKANYTEEEMNLYERLDALNRKYSKYWEIHRNVELVPWMLENWKMVVRFVNGTKEGHSVNIENLVEMALNSKYFVLIADYIDRLTESEKDVFIRIIKACENNPWWDESMVSIVAYWLAHHAYDMYDSTNDYEIADENTHGLQYGGRAVKVNPYRNGSYSDACFVNDVHTMLELGKRYGVNLKKTDYFRMRYQLRCMYKQDILANGENGKFAEVQNRIADKVKFSYEGYTVVLPLKIEDLKNESINQNNCVYSYHTDYVLKAQEYIVFIRKEDTPDESLITCSIEPRTGRITGYLGKNNKSVTDKTLVEFEKLFQKHLNENWK